MPQQIQRERTKDWKVPMSEVVCWVGVKRCGCYVAVAIDDGDPKRKKGLEQSKRDFLRSGLSVVRVSWATWESDYRPKFSRCKCQPDSDEGAE